MSKWVYLSYKLDSETPVYGNEQGLIIEKTKEIEKGDSCNTSLWKLPNHLGTHVDFPKHFDLNGNSLDTYEADFWIFKNVWLIDISNNRELNEIDGNSIRVGGIPEKTELLLIKTGCGSIRGKAEYWRNSPAFSPDLYSLLKKRCLCLRAVGFDTISISSLQNRPLGREAHKAFLCSNKPILIIEDMNLCEVDGDIGIKQIIVAPIRVNDTDGAPCTVLGELKYGMGSGIF